MKCTISPGGFAAPVLALAAVLALGWGAADAQAPATSLATNFGANANKPIDIQANVLEIDDKKKTATFKGDVSATQGDFNMKANELIVSYVAKKTEGKDAARPALPGGGGADISHIEARGNVTITSKDNQQATGDTALFKVKEQMVYLTGDVKVKQGDAVVGAESLTINLVESTASFAPGGRRVTAVLPPRMQDKDKDKDKGKAKDQHRSD